MPSKNYAQFTCKHNKTSNRAELTRVANPKIKIELAAGFPQETADAVRAFFCDRSKKTIASTSLRWQSVEWPTRTGSQEFDQGLRVYAECAGSWQTVVHFKNTTTPTQARSQLYKKLSQSHVPLLPQQSAYADEFRDYDWHKGKRQASLLYATMGSGKTRAVLAAISAAKPSSRKSDKWRVLIVCSNTLIGNWMQTIESSPQGVGETKFVIMGYTEFRNTFHEAQENGFGDISQYIVVVDEAHNYRNLTKAMLEDVTLLRKALFLFLLTGTPLQNEPDEICAILALLRCCDSFVDDDNDETFECDPAALARQMPAIEATLRARNSVFYYDPASYDAEKFAEHYPATKEVIERVPMSAPQALEYVMSQSGLTLIGPYEIRTARRNSYHALTRAISNVIDPDRPEESPKIRKVTENILSGKYRGPHVVFSHYLDRGVNAVEKYLVEQAKKAGKKLTLARVTGVVDGRERDEIVSNYNDGKTDVLFITDAAREGVDLHGTGTMHVLEVAENLHGEGQTMGRVARFGSHSHLPDAQQSVTFIKYRSTFPSVEAVRKQRSALERYFFDTYKLEAKDVFDIAAELARLFRESSDNKTVDEKFSENNIRKAKLLAPWLNMLKTVGDRRKQIAAAAAKQPIMKAAPKKRKQEKLTAEQVRSFTNELCIAAVDSKRTKNK